MEPDADHTWLLKIVALARDPDVNLNELLALLSSAPALATEIARASSCAPWNVPGRAPRIKRAVLVLGPKSVAGIAAALWVRDRVRAACDAGDPEPRWRHALASAVFAEGIARRLELPLELDAWLGGLFHLPGLGALPSAVGPSVTPLVRAAHGLLEPFSGCVAGMSGDGLLFDVGLLADELADLSRELEQRLKDAAAALR